MLKQLALVFGMFIAVAMTQSQNSQLSSVIAKQVSALVNATASQSNSTRLGVPTSITSIASCGTDLECLITNILTAFILDPLVYGLRGLLLPIVILVRFLLLAVQFILNIILGLVTGLLQSVLATLPLGDTGPQLITTLRNVQSLLNQLLPQISQLLENLRMLPLAGR